MFRMQFGMANTRAKSKQKHEMFAMGVKYLSSITADHHAQIDLRRARLLRALTHPGRRPRDTRVHDAREQLFEDKMHFECFVLGQMCVWLAILKLRGSLYIICGTIFSLILFIYSLHIKC